MIKWGKQPSGVETVTGWLFEGLIKCHIWPGADDLNVSFYGPDGKTQRLPETFKDIKQAKHAAESYIRQVIKLDAQPGFGCMAITLTGPENELLGHATIDLLNPLYSLPGGSAHLIEAITHQARILAHLWTANDSKMYKERKNP